MNKITVKRVCVAVIAAAILFVCAILVSWLIEYLLSVADRFSYGRCGVGIALFGAMVWWIYKMLVSMGTNQ